MALTFRASNFRIDDIRYPVLTKPTGTSEGDIMFALFSIWGQTTLPVPPSGWILLGNATLNTYLYGYLLYYKIATNSEPANYTWDLNFGSEASSIIASYYGDFDKTNPISAVSNTAYTTSNTTVRASSITTARANMPLLFFGGLYRTSTTTFTKPSVPTTDWIEDIDAGSTTFDRYLTICHMVWTSSGATGNMDAIASSTPEYKHAFAVALNIPVVAPTVTTQAVTSIASTTVVGNGNITNIGSENAYQQGMAYMPGTSGDISFLNVSDPSFESGVLTGVGTMTKSAAQAKYGSNSMKVTWDSGLYAYSNLAFTDSFLIDKYVTFGAWVWSDTANSAHLIINENFTGGYTPVYTAYHSGNSTWEWLTCSIKIDSAMTALVLQCVIAATSTTPNCYFDGILACYSSTGFPVLTFASGSFGTGAFTTNLTGLTRATDYRVVAFASNQYGTSYGSTVGFKTLAVAPTVTTTSVNSITQSSLIATGNLTDNGGETWEIGFVWSTTLNPTITDNKVIVTGGIGAYNTLISGFTANTDYHIRAYATNSIGTSYGTDIAFSTLASGPMVKRRVSFLSKAQSLTIQLSNNAVDETFTVLQFAVAGEKQDKNTFTPSSIISIN